MLEMFLVSTSGVLSPEIPRVPAPGGAGKKRPAWDLKGRLEDMEAAQANTLQKIADLQAKNTDLTTNVVEKETIVVQNTEELNNVKNAKSDLEKQVRRTSN